MYRKMLVKAVAELDSSITVTCTECGDEALYTIMVNDFDIIVVDSEIPGIGLFEIIRTAKHELPEAPVLIGVRPSRTQERRISEALEMGADYTLVKPLQSSYADNLRTAKCKIEEIINALGKGKSNVKKQVKTFSPKKKFHPELVLIASSTGGPKALKTLFDGLLEDFPAPVLLVQHVPEPPLFCESLVRDLSTKTRLRVKIAENGDAIKAGTVYLAPGGLHMKLTAKGKLKLDDSPPVNSLKPAADVLFKSVAEEFKGSGVLAIILTGMGNDGEQGLAALKEKQNCLCVAQSERTCVVYGMPRAAVEGGYADKVLDLNDISAVLKEIN